MKLQKSQLLLVIILAFLFGAIVTGGFYVLGTPVGGR